MSVHVNHPRELTVEVKAALERLANAGIPLGNQSVLLKGVNDDADVMKVLVQKLLRARVRPYYLYQCDLIKGSSHLRTSVGKGLEIIENLRGHTSGYAVPQYVIDGPGGDDATLRPNQVLAVSLSASPIDKITQQRIVECCGPTLLTSYGLRSLAPGQPGYRGVYRGSVSDRDGSYHQGPVWAWLLGHWALAHYRVHGDVVAARPSIAVSGSHGKGTTAAMIAYVLREAGRDPAWLIGAPVPQLGSNAGFGSGYLVVEADEAGHPALVGVGV